MGPQSTLVSLFHFFRAKQIKRPDGSPFVHLSDMIENNAWLNPFGGGDIWDSFLTAWEARNSPNCLLLCFEDLVVRKAAHIAVLKRFMYTTEWDEEEAVVNSVLPMTSKDFMLQHQDKFDESGAKKRQVEVGRFNEGLDVALRIRSDSSSTKTEQEVITELGALQSYFDAQWRVKMLPVTGTRNYDEFRVNIQDFQHSRP